MSDVPIMRIIAEDAITDEKLVYDCVEKKDYDKLLEQYAHAKQSLDQFNIDSLKEREKREAELQSQLEWHEENLNKIKEVFATQTTLLQERLNQTLVRLEKCEGLLREVFDRDCYHEIGEPTAGKIDEYFAEVEK